MPVKKTILLYLLLFSFQLFSCSKEDLENDILISINNQTGGKLTDVSVFSSGSSGDFEARYGSIAANKTSKYQRHSSVEGSYPLYKLTLQDAGAIQCRMLRCGMGAYYLEPGKYSLIIEKFYDGVRCYYVKD